MGSVYGTAGGSLEQASTASWAANERVAQIGAAGERSLARVLEAWAVRPDGPDVFHDVTIPSGHGANIDHVVVGSSEVLLIDAKAWKPAFYWTYGGVTRRGFEAFPFGDKRTLPNALAAFTRHLERRGAVMPFAVPLVVTVPANTHPKSAPVFAYRPIDARARTLETLARFPQLSLPNGQAPHPTAAAFAALTR